MGDMEKPSRDFKGIWIPKDIWESNQLSIMEKVLFVEIHSLDNERGCYASNRYFSEFFHVSKRQIQTYIAGLKAKGFITVTIQNRYERVIRAAGKYARVRREALRQLRQDQAGLVHRFRIGGMKDCSFPLRRKLRDSNTMNKPMNNTGTTFKKKAAPETSARPLQQII